MIISKFRDHLHTIPELGFKEYKTTAYLISILEKYRCQIIKITDTGVLAYFNFHQKTTIAYRADIDGLPIQEQSSCPNPSIHPQMMHACGHDAHMAIVLGLADYLNSCPKTFKHNVLLIFQPSEESQGGAKKVLNHPFLKTLNIIHIFALHVWPMLEAGKIFSKSGPLLAKAAEIDLIIKGKASHVANYHLGIDSLEIASKLLLDIYELEKSLDSKIPRLLRFGQMQSGQARNIISDKTTLLGTIRAFDEQVFNFLYQELVNMTKKYQNEFHCIIDIQLSDAYPPVINDYATFEKVCQLIDLHSLKKPLMQAEDFGYYCNHYKTFFFLLGVGENIVLHNPAFYFDNQILNNGLQTFIKLLDI